MKSSIRASILILSIWVLVFLTILSLGLYKTISPQLEALKRIEYRISAYHLVRGVIANVLYEFKTDQTDFDTLLELSKERTFGRGNIKAHYKLLDIGSRININIAPQSIMIRLANNDIELRAAISPSKIEGNKAFEVKEQLLLLDQVSQDYYDSIKDLITVYGKNVYNINTVSTSVLSVLGIEPSVINQLDSFRLGEDGELGTEDDGIFETKTDISAFNKGLNRKSIFKVQSEIYKIDIKIKHYDAEVLDYDIIIDNSGTVLMWQES